MEKVLEITTHFVYNCTEFVGGQVMGEAKYSCTQYTAAGVILYYYSMTLERVE